VPEKYDLLAQCLLAHVALREVWVCLREEEEYKQRTAASEGSLEPEDYSPRAECYDHALDLLVLFRVVVGGLTYTEKRAKCGPD
jgi:hypothetical protein